MSDDVPMSNATSRGLWIVSEKENVLFAIENDALVYGLIDQPRKNEVISAFQSGMEAARLAKDMTYMPLETVLRIDADIKTTVIYIICQPAEGSREARHLFTCKDKEEQEAVMDALQQKLGQEWTRQLTQSSRWEGAFAPLVCLVVAGILAAGLYSVVTGQDQGGGGNVHVRGNSVVIIIVAIIKFFPPIVSLILALIALALLLVWFLYELLLPSKYDTLMPAKTNSM